MSASSDKSLQITCPRHFCEVAKFNFFPPNICQVMFVVLSRKDQTEVNHLVINHRCTKTTTNRFLFTYLGLLRFFLTVGGGLGGQILNFPLECSTTSWQGSFVVVEKLHMRWLPLTP